MRTNHFNKHLVLPDRKLVKNPSEQFSAPPKHRGRELNPFGKTVLSTFFINHDSASFVEFQEPESKENGVKASRVHKRTFFFIDYSAFRQMPASLCASMLLATSSGYSCIRV